ncbi:exodeoxyribonuclease VII large subunit [Celerinatantimonas yamalensis]|uniref:Exodeoxyribonuclease 7 large subunit n=1 Tax=Celerinatantimonas yamalensis TaxID=559956 RepID=A0ABW9GA76_9GAMM
MDSSTPSRNILSVSQLNEKVRQHLELHIGEIWLQGEISNLVRPYSGHWYFSLKDSQAQVRCAMFKGQNRKILFDVEDGQQVLIRARISVYEPRGEYQLIVQSMQPDGLGAMQLAYEQLRCKLAAEGLFSEQRKRPLPEVVRQVGVITSASGAAFHDITAVLKRLAPSITVILYPSSVQGKEAPAALRQALQLANQRDEVDLLIIGRGGGSLEDLFAFNDEALARLVAESQLPIISAVGHEIDFTLTDFASDWRAPTPSAAAERVAYGVHQLQRIQSQLSERLEQLANQWLSPYQLRQQHLHQRLLNQSPLRQLRMRQQQLDELQQRLHDALTRLYQQRHKEQQSMQARLTRITPAQRIALATERLQALNIRLNRASLTLWHDKQQIFTQTVAQLNALSPLATLSRGYSAVRSDTGQWLTHIHHLRLDQSVVITMQDGQAKAIVTAIEPTSAHNPPHQ